MNNNVDAILLPINKVCNAQRDEMLVLMSKYYDGVTKTSFNNDLNDKSHIILLMDDEQLIGFSTITTLTSAELSNSICVYSGDTIVDSQYWGQQLLVRLWCEYIAQVRNANPNIDIYWLLTSKGIKTYRFIPLFFYEYYPSPKIMNTSKQRNLKIHLDSFASKLYGDLYNKDTNLITHISSTQKLKKIPILSKLDSTDKEGVSFFYSMNPNWYEGIELATVVHVCSDNLTRAGHRAFSRINNGVHTDSA